MNFERARRIVNAEETIDVLLNGAPVWIEDLDPETNTARVRLVDGSKKSVEVPVAELVEGRFM
ncbi:MAG: H-type small acid-soluble spore protein [Bacillota bacterium]|nr:H-type small acid-soluble spore protein [Bacillota bacterium]